MKTLKSVYAAIGFLTISLSIEIMAFTTFPVKPIKSAEKPLVSMQCDLKGEIQETKPSIRPIGTPYNDDNLFSAYLSSMEEVLGSFRVMQKKDSIEDLEQAKKFLFAPQRYVQIKECSKPESDSESYLQTKQSFQDCRKEQSKSFQDATGLSQNQKQLVVRALSYMGDYCAKKRMSAPLYVAWDKIKESGVSPKENAISAYLYMLSSMPLEKDFEYDIATEVAIYHDLIYKPTENTVSISIKSLVERGRTEQAEQLLWDLEATARENAKVVNNNPNAKKKQKEHDLLKLRTCIPVLESFFNDGNITRGFQLYMKMQTIPSVIFDAETYVLMLTSLARRGFFRNTANAAHAISTSVLDELGFEQGYGAGLFNGLVSQMAEDVLDISSDSAKEIRNAFVDSFSSLNPSAQKAGRNLYHVPFDCDMAPLSTLSKADELVANRVRLGTNSTSCPRTNATLRLIQLDEDQRKHVHDTLLEMADHQFEVYQAKMQQKSKKAKTASDPLEDNYAKKHIEGFAKWLNEREGNPFTSIVDGANVAYYGLGTVNYHQIEQMVTSLEERGETPLVVIPQKYTQKKFWLRQGYVQELPEDQMQIMENLNETGRMYIVPHRCLDDYYWMLSSVSDQTRSRNGMNLDVSEPTESTNNTKTERFIGKRPILISNDQMRDHKLELLEPRLFRRWVSNHIVNYHFPPYVKDPKEKRDVTFAPADITSQEIQSNPSNSNGNGDDGALAWHFPVREWGKFDRFCVRIPTI